MLGRQRIRLPYKLTFKVEILTKEECTKYLGLQLHFNNKRQLRSRTLL